MELGGLIYLLALIFIFSFLGRKEVGLGILIGGLIAFINFRLMELFCEKLIQNKTTKRVYMASQILLKSTFPLVMILLALWVFEINLLGLTLGISAVVVAILGYGIWLMAEQLFLTKDI